MPRSTAVDPLRSLPGYALIRASAIAMDQLKRQMKSVALRPVDASVLLVIQSNPGITQSKIGRMLDIAPPNMATLVSRLLERMLVERNDIDGRSQGLVLTTAGQTLAQKSLRIMKEHEVTLMAQVPATHRQAFLTSLQSLLPPVEVAHSSRTPPRKT